MQAFNRLIPGIYKPASNSWWKTHFAAVSFYERREEAVR